MEGCIHHGILLPSGRSLAYARIEPVCGACGWLLGDAACRRSRVATAFSLLHCDRPCKRSIASEPQLPVACSSFACKLSVGRTDLGSPAISCVLLSHGRALGGESETRGRSPFRLGYAWVMHSFRSCAHQPQEMHPARCIAFDDDRSSGRDGAGQQMMLPAERNDGLPGFDILHFGSIVP